MFEVANKPLPFSPATLISSCLGGGFNSPCTTTSTGVSILQEIEVVRVAVGQDMLLVPVIKLNFV